MTHRGASLMEWAHMQAAAFVTRSKGPAAVPLSVLVAEAYLHGANDALADETERIRALAVPVRNLASAVERAAKDGLARAANTVQHDPAFILPTGERVTRDAAAPRQP